MIKQYFKWLLEKLLKTKILLIIGALLLFLIPFVTFILSGYTILALIWFCTSELICPSFIVWYIYDYK